jgi:hypothetical protein
MESLDKHHETNAEALEDNCCVQGNSLIEAYYWSQFGFLAVGRQTGRNPLVHIVGESDKQVGSETSSVRRIREQRTVYIENDCLRGTDSDESPT